MGLYNLDILCITESKLDSSHIDAEISIPNFVHYRGDRDFKIKVENSIEISDGGGSIIYVRSSIPSEIISSINAPDSVAVAVKTRIGNIAIGCMYRSQGLSPLQNDKLFSAIKDLSLDQTFSETIIMGDFNLPDISWIAGTVSGKVNKNIQSNF